MPIIWKPIINTVVIDIPVIWKPIIDIPVINEPNIHKSAVDMPITEKPIIDNPVIASDRRERGNLLRIFFSFGIQFYLSQFQARFLSPNDPHPRRRNTEVRCQNLDNFLIGFSLGR